MNKKYAVIVKVRKQVGAFTSNPDSINTKFNFLIDLENHPQKNEVQLDWFYNSETNSFSKEGKVIYSENVQIEKPFPELSQLDRIEMAINITADQYRQEGAEALVLELIESGVL